MIEATNDRGAVCARVTPFSEDGRAWAVAVRWEDAAAGLPTGTAWAAAIDAGIAACRDGGAASIRSRVVVLASGIPERLVAARAALHRDALAARGFRRWGERIEWRQGLDDALAALAEHQGKAVLSWRPADVNDEADMARAADLLMAVQEGDPDSDPADDARGFIGALLDDGAAAQAPERIQIGSWEGVPAVVLLLTACPDDGWASISYLGVLPAFRGLGIGKEALVHGLRCLKAMGGRVYHDGTAAANAAARALLSGLGSPPYRVIEEWRLAGS